MLLSKIIYYPIKSLKGIEVSSHLATPLGLKWDRRWMLIEQNGEFVSQRRDPKLAILDVNPFSDGWLVSHMTHGEVHIPFESLGQVEQVVTVWGDVFSARRATKNTEAYFSEFLNRSIRMVYHHDPEARPVDINYAQDSDRVGFADGFPYLILGDSSIAACQNLCAEDEIDWRRFRPNIVVSGAEPFAEDGWSAIQVGSAIFDLVKPCARCVMITVNPDTGQKGADILKSIASVRRQEKGIMVGQNGLVRAPVHLQVGDRVHILGEK